VAAVAGRLLETLEPEVIETDDTAELPVLDADETLFVVLGALEGKALLPMELGREDEVVSEEDCDEELVWAAEETDDPVEELV
jgi:hypothetical protein